LNQVNTKQTNGQLTPQQAAELTQQAKAIQQAIGCSNIGGMFGQSSPSLVPLPMPSQLIGQKSGLWLINSVKK